MPGKIVFITIPWFLPAFKAGGPVQSIANMVKELDEGYSFYIYTSNTDLHGLPIAVAKTNEWTAYNGHTKVWYAVKNNRSQNLVDEVEKIKPDCLYIIGLFDWHFNIVPLLYAKTRDKLLSVRGMLHPGALGQKAIKKKLFLQGMKWWKPGKKCRFHATDETEAGFIKNVFGNEAATSVAGNFPKLLEPSTAPEKEKGMLRMVSIGIISPMKNYLMVLQALRQIKAIVHYDIYGPVKEPAYWEQCLAAIQLLPTNITVEYHQELPPHKVGSKLEGHHMFILPSKSENYGHAIVEALSAGLPVITSNGVPWLGLKEAGAGLNVELGTGNLEQEIGKDGRIDGLVSAIEFFAAMDQEEWNGYSAGSVKYIHSKIDVAELRVAYGEMFGKFCLEL
jgi:glycosyltransferase involved in cell wall biosynthesis